jgi:thiol-disulfide isomerase/thioredoxin
MLSLPAYAQNLYVWQKIPGNKPAPSGEFTLAGQAKPATLAQWHGQPVLLNFWAMWCTPCIAELPTLAKLQKHYNNGQLRVVAMSIDENNINEIQAFLKKNNIAPPNLAHDLNNNIHGPLRGDGVPLTYLISADGKLLASYEGSANWNSKKQRQKIDELLGR